MISIASRSFSSGGPHTWIATGAPGLATRPASESAWAMSSAKKKQLKPVTRSKRSEAKGRFSISPTRTSASGNTAARQRCQGLRGIEPGDLAPALRGEPQVRTRSAADVEDAPTGPRARPSEHLLVVRRLLVLAERPVPRCRAPERPPATCAALDGGIQDVLSYDIDYE